MRPRWSQRTRWLVAAGLALAVIGPLGYFWGTSLIPSTYSVMDMGYPDLAAARRT
jgi:hypothetical protein